MSLKPFNLLALGGLGLSILLGNSVAIAQTDNSDLEPVVVPTIPSDSTDTTTTPPSTTPPTDTTTPPVDEIARFSCQLDNNQWAVMYQPQSQPNQYYSWATPKALGGGWTPQKRCEAIASRLESYRPEGLQELRTGRENNYNIVCITTQENPACRIVFTVPPGQDPYVTRNRVFENLTVADSGQDTLPVTTFLGRGGGGSQLDQLINLGQSLLNGGRNNAVFSSKKPINLRPFLDPADGGTATKLQRGRSIPTNRSNTRLNPGKFR